jgi:hypothetical protein
VAQLESHVNHDFDHITIPSHTVFPSPGGRVLNDDNFRHRIFAPAARRSGLAPLRFHDYADLFVMPTFLGFACSAVVSALRLSA